MPDNRRHMGSVVLFTLLELLVVIAIIGVLCSLLSPALMSLKEKAKQLQCSNHLKQYGASGMLYMMDYNGWGPMTTGSFLAFENASCDELKMWSGVLAPYMNLDKRTFLNFVCPQFTADRGGAPLPPYIYNLSWWRQWIGFSYSMTCIHTQNDLDASKEYQYVMYKPHRVSTPSRFMWIADYASGNLISPQPELKYSGGSFVKFASWDDPKGLHMRKSNSIVFMDGHTDSKSVAQLRNERYTYEK